MVSGIEETPALSLDEKKTLLRISRQTLVEYLKSGKTISTKTDTPALLQERAVFVTFYTRSTGDLRGCRGETVARTTLIEAVKKMTIASAIDDPRFPKVELSEVENLRIEINVLTPMYTIFPDDIIVGTHGVMLIKNTFAALFLPQVPVTYNWDKETYLNQLCKKAGLPPGAWQDDDAELFAFGSEEWGEH